MVTEYLFDFYNILVENIFGSVFLSIVGIAALIFIILIVCRSSMTFMAYWLTFYGFVMATFYIGTLGLLLAWILGGAFLTYAMIKTFGREG